jgi:hypothetical protein
MRRHDGLEVVRQVAGTGALVGVPGKFELALLDHIGGIGIGRSDVPPGIIFQVRVHAGISPSMVEVQMGVDHPRDITRQKPRRCQRVLQLGGALQSLILDAIDVQKLGVFLVPESRVDEHQPIGVLDQHTAHGERNPISGIRLDSGAPQRPRHHPEHGPAVQALPTALQAVAAKSADVECVL